MNRFIAISLVVAAVQLAGQDKPPVLRGGEPADDVVVSLPGDPAPAPVAFLDPDDHRPLLRRAPKPVFPAEFERDSAAFSQKFVGLWAADDAYNLFGEPLRERIVLDDSDAESGRIYAYSDPTGRYREIELEFAKDTGLLRTIFAYPWRLTWADCRKLWGSNVQSTEANKGRTFHSYVNRRIDVLVDPAGKVISLGLY